MMVQRTLVTASSYISDCESHGHRITLPVFQRIGAAAQTMPYAGLAEDIRKKEKRIERALTRSQWLPDTSSRLPDNCTKPIKEDTVAFPAA